jgi:hypothetical protein
VATATAEELRLFHEVQVRSRSGPPGISWGRHLPVIRRRD